MTARTPAQPAHPTRRPAAGEDPTGSTWWASLPPRLRTALGVSLLGAVALAVGPLLPVVSPAVPAGFAAAPLLVVIALLPTALAVGLATRGWTPAVAAVLLAAALFAPGRALIDAQLAAEGRFATRPELAMPGLLAHLHGAVGLWLLLAGHVLTLVAGLLAVGTEAAPDQSAPAEREPGRQQGPVVFGLCLGALAAIGLIAAPFGSDVLFMLAKGTLDAPALVLVGGVLVAAAVPVAITVAVTATDALVARGWLLGGAVCVVAIALPRLVSGLAVPGLHPSWGPCLALAVALAMIGWTMLGTGRVDPTNAEPAELRLPAQHRLHVLTGVFGLLAAGAALVGADTNLFVLPAGVPQPDTFASRLLIPAAVLLAVCSVGLLVPRAAATVRPAFAVAWAVVPLAGFTALDEALTATRLSGVGIGPGTWATGLAMLAALVAAGCAGLAGGVERDDVDRTSLTWQPVVLAPAVAAALLAIGAFGLPLLRAPDYVAPGLWTDFRFGSWGLVCGLVMVLAAAALAPRSRPVRGAALLLGAAGVVLVRLLGLPLTKDLVPGATAGPALLLSVACALCLVAGAVAAVVLARRSPVRVAADNL